MCVCVWILAGFQSYGIFNVADFGNVIIFFILIPFSALILIQRERERQSKRKKEKEKEKEKIE